MNILLKIFCIFLYASLSFSEGDVELRETLKIIEVELSEIEKSVSVSTQRDQTILDLKIKLSDYLATLSKFEDISQISKTTLELDKFTNDFNRWENEAKDLSDRINEISSSLIQLEEVINKANSLSMKRTFSSAKKKAEYFLEIVKSHKGFLIQSKNDINSWKSLVQDRLNKNFNSNLFRWNGEQVLKELKKPLVMIKHDFLDFIIASGKLSFNDYSDQEKRNLLTTLGFAVLISFLFLNGGAFLIKNYFKTNHSMNEISKVGPVIKEIFKSRKTLVSSMFSITFLWLNEGVNAVPINIFVALIFSGILVFTWLTFGTHLFIEINKQIYGIENGKKPRFFTEALVVIFILLRSMDSYLLINNVHYSMITSILFFIIFMKMSKFIYKQISSSDKALKSFTFISFIKFSTLLLSSLLFVGAFADLIGYFDAGKAIISITLKNLSYVIVSIFSYYVLNAKLESTKNKRSTSTQAQFFSFLATSVPIVIVLILCILFAQTIFNVFYQYGNFFSASIVHVGEFNLTVDMPVKIVMSSYLLRLLYLFIIFMVENYLLDIFKIQPKYLPNIITIFRYSFILIFISVFASLLGMTYKNIVILASALGVGIGFGLQNIANNFISGIILIFEQPIRVGDVIEVNGNLAKVKHIGIRSVIVTTLENSSVIIPNSDLLSNKLTNWTFANNIVVLKCNVGVAYGSDVELVQKILMDVALNDPDVQRDPVPQILFDEFADSSLNFVMKVWISKPFEFMPIKSRILSSIDKSFRVHGITIPFPQRDIHFIGDKP